MLYDLYYFVEPCAFPQKEQQVGEYILSSEPGLVEATYFEYTNRYILKNPMLPNVRFEPDEIIRENYPKQHPVTLIRRLNFEAENEQEAMDKTREDVRVLTCLLSLERGCAAQYFEVLVVDKQGSMTWQFYHEAYNGNVLAPFNSISTILNKYLIACKKNPAFIMQATLLRAAKVEGMAAGVWDAQYFRYWNLLEVMATSDFGEVDTAKDRVIKMFEERYSAANMSLAVGEIDIIEEIPIWYRHRNCVAHYGSCHMDNPDICKDKPVHLKCRNRMQKSIENNADMSLWVLDHSTTDILRMRMFEASKAAAKNLKEGT